MINSNVKKALCVSLFAISMASAAVETSGGAANFMEKAAEGLQGVTQEAGKSVRMNNVLCKPKTTIKGNTIIQTIKVSGKGKANGRIVNSHCGTLKLENNTIVQDLNASGSGQLDGGVF